MRITSLPYVDEHSVVIPASPDDVWRGLVERVERADSRSGAARYARLVGAAYSGAEGPRPLAVGSTVPGFRVATADPGHELALVGRHHFSTYALVFRLSALPAGHTLLHAETRARFPGPLGTAYRFLVIVSRAHTLGVRRLLGSIRRAAVDSRP